MCRASRRRPLIDACSLPAPAPSLQRRLGHAFRSRPEGTSDSSVEGPGLKLAKGARIGLVVSPGRPATRSGARYRERAGKHIGAGRLPSRSCPPNLVRRAVVLQRSAPRIVTTKEPFPFALARARRLPVVSRTSSDARKACPGRDRRGPADTQRGLECGDRLIAANRSSALATSPLRSPEPRASRPGYAPLSREGNLDSARSVDMDEHLVAAAALVSQRTWPDRPWPFQDTSESFSSTSSNRTVNPAASSSRLNRRAPPRRRRRIALDDARRPCCACCVYVTSSSCGQPFAGWEPRSAWTSCMPPRSRSRLTALAALPPQPPPGIRGRSESARIDLRARISFRRESTTVFRDPELP